VHVTVALEESKVVRQEHDEHTLERVIQPVHLATCSYLWFRYQKQNAIRRRTIPHQPCPLPTIVRPHHAISTKSQNQPHAPYSSSHVPPFRQHLVQSQTPCIATGVSLGISRKSKPQTASRSTPRTEQPGRSDLAAPSPPRRAVALQDAQQQLLAVLVGAALHPLVPIPTHVVAMGCLFVSSAFPAASTAPASRA
jgi:hypothetical protein